eukprot:440748-Prymnesium_polylepis.1
MGFVLEKSASIPSHIYFPSGRAVPCRCSHTAGRTMTLDSSRRRVSSLTRRPAVPHTHAHTARWRP